MMTLRTLLTMLFTFALVHTVQAACSPYMGMASLNEFYKERANQALDPADFVEVKILNPAITASIFNTWTLRVCEEDEPGNNNDADGCSATISVNTFTEKTPPWIVLKGNIGTYINFKTGFDAILRDGNGDVIDYVSVDGYNPQQNASCPPASLPFDTTAGAPGASDKFIYRRPDGTGDWENPPSGSTPPTEDGTNDTGPGGGTAVPVSINNVTVLKGVTAVFTLSISSAQTYNVSVQYRTLNATAIAGTDYTTTSGTATIIAGATSTTVSVPTNAASSSGEVFFYLYLSNPVNGSITNHYPTGTILANALAAWTMEQTGWSGAAGEVIDSSTNGYHGTGLNGANTANTTPAIPGSPGTCRYGVFDGNNDHIALPSFPNLTSSFTITAWIRPNIVNNDQRIFADDQNNSGGYAFSLGDNGNGQLRFFSRNVTPVFIDSGAVISAGNWYHVAAVHNVTNKTRQIFVNGVAVTTAQTYTGTWGTDTGVASIGGENNNAGSEATANWRFNGLIDEVRVYSSALNASAITTVMNITRPCAAAGLHHIEIQHDGSGLTCEPESITLRACANSTCSSLYTGNVTVDLTPGGWVGGNTRLISGGQSTVQYRNTSATTINYGVAGANPAASNAYTCLNTVTGSNSCAQTFYNSGFIYSIPTQTSCATSTAITLRAVRLDDTTQACVPTFNSQTRNIVFSLSYLNPTTGNRSLTLNHGGTNYTPINNVTSQTVPVNFNGSGQATFTVNYPDAGQISLNSRYTGSAGGGDAGLTMTGSASFVTKPYRLFVFADEANADCPASAPSCTAFKRAGEPFNLRVRAACSDNSVTPNFQLNNLTLTHINTAPAIVQGTISVANFSIAPADQGERLILQTVSDVGAYTFSAGLPAGNYLGVTVGDSTLNTSNIIGRFYPDHFCLTANQLVNRTDSNTATACTAGFSYLDEDFDARFTLSAQAMGQVCGSGSVTQNYHGAWSKFVTPFSESTSLPSETGKWNLAAVNNPGATAQNLNTRIDINSAASTPSNGQFSNGALAIVARLNINRSGSAPSFTAEAPLTDVHIGINPLDSDNVAIDSRDLSIGGSNYRDIGTTQLIFGRLFADNAFGSNLPDVGLDMYARTQYCNTVSAGSCTQWLARNDDSCSLYNVNPPAGVELRAMPSIGTPGYYQRASASLPSATFDFADDGTAPSYARVHVPDTRNHASGWRLIYTAGGAGGDFIIPYRFPFNTDPNVHPYLLHVNGTASFGHFRGDDRIIYWREVLE